MGGRVLLDGQDVTGQKPYALARRGLCHLPEGHGIFPSLTVKENIVLSSPKEGEGKRREAGTSFQRWRRVSVSRREA